MARARIAASLAALSGCLDPAITAPADAPPSEPAHDPSNALAYEPPPGEDICALLPPDGPCSLACDYEALAELGPEGACVSYYCELTDGRPFALSACNHPDP